MDIKKILSYVDHTLLSQSATWEEIRAVLDDGMKYSCASCCIPASYVKEAKEYVGDKLAICTVIGFPNGYSTTATKCFETEDAVKNGADEIDMVINIGWLKDKRYDLLLNEIKAIKEACHGKLLKVIIETCLLTDEEKVKMCQIVSESGADFIKTSTGFSTAGATRHDVEIFANNVADYLKIKAAGGISSLEDAEDFIALGATRLGTSRIVKIVKAMEKGEKNDKQDTSY
ncbi:MAG: deoxyribose-phosphate aldolase [Oscillospiraceae bacterium]|nr:deoxyribose-phosphate aldolase [Oscillospiraceae bacterium]MBQ8338439.1 deoxyribose-phosphate aldolase [Oscillospiraceae bacterium]